MKRRHTFIALLLCALGLQAQSDYTHGLSVWFDKPTTLNGRSIWYGGRPDKWVGRGKPEWAGDANYNADKEWESQSLPIGNGSIGANILGSLEAERITFNEKTLWRGGPNTENGAEYYWNVNKKSASDVVRFITVIHPSTDATVAAEFKSAFSKTSSSVKVTVNGTSYDLAYSL